MSQTSHSPLTARYRPQTFKQVAGQDTLKSILSRAAGLGQAAPAYLFSGTRGVGKTTVARVFAKALNCRKGPAAEPCNECDLCRAVTAGSCIDVVEIDGASNRGIDDVRKLKEVVGYAPMDGKYKVFIIDEAHMLSREAFNALLKTLEEPPAGVVFIMATTEPHKFPATIISRCQHYVFTRLSEAELQAHLGNVLEQEKIAFDPAAVRLIARRGAGSVRDSMSLLGQVLALGISSVSEEAVRSVLGLAGHDAFLRLLQCFRTGDGIGLVGLLQKLLEGGLDMGFFLREMAGLWRNLFLLRQNGKIAIPLLEMHEGEAQVLLDEALKFSLQHIHAAWQMTLEGQRRVLTSLEPAQALELLFLNLSMLPRLLPIQDASGAGIGSGGVGGAGGNTSEGLPSGSNNTAGNETSASSAQVAPRNQISSGPDDFISAGPEFSTDAVEYNFHDLSANSDQIGIAEFSHEMAPAAVSFATPEPESAMAANEPAPMPSGTDTAPAFATVPSLAEDNIAITQHEASADLPWPTDDEKTETTAFTELEAQVSHQDSPRAFGEERHSAPVSDDAIPDSTEDSPSPSRSLPGASASSASPPPMMLHHKLKEEIFNHAMVQQLDEVFGVSLVNFGQDFNHRPRKLSAEQ